MELKSFKHQKPVVIMWLENHPPTRDSDTKLIANIWAHTIGVQNLETVTARQMLQMFVDGTLPSAETISRCRRKVQEEMPHLRGKTYNERQNRSEILRTEIKDL